MNRITETHLFRAMAKPENRSTAAITVLLFLLVGIAAAVPFGRRLEVDLSRPERTGLLVQVNFVGFGAPGADGRVVEAGKAAKLVFNRALPPRFALDVIATSRPATSELATSNTATSNAPGPAEATHLALTMGSSKHEIAIGDPAAGDEGRRVVIDNPDGGRVLGVSVPRGSSVRRSHTGAVAIQHITIEPMPPASPRQG